MSNPNPNQPKDPQGAYYDSLDELDLPNNPKPTQSSEELELKKILSELKYSDGTPLSELPDVLDDYTDSILDLYISRAKVAEAIRDQITNGAFADINDMNIYHNSLLVEIRKELL